ncbi:MAG: TetR/AcrR family transcriptional regulator [Candidatus Abyssobacteria bacterium SURF_17]|uniref:TetR/AcrR family transcriptional regulator n=1 Tax=Candidatus Abyssobacteria bacterium SURF_17 TaxID=2093361 RepID=A0A419EX26_9BACT|nr:MAG: TetR/AcrR family transcriptional regulator [Candidatus Abyssubacteria bacterium SURF_17]
MKTLPKRRRRTKGSTVETKQRIVDAALAIAAAKGFEQATTAEIAQQAGVAEGSIYNYFRTKDDLLIHMVGQYASSFLRQLEDEVGEEQDALKKLERLISFHIRFFTQEGNIFQVIYGKTPGTRVRMARIIRVAIVPYVSILEGIIGEGIRQGKIRKLNPQVAASFLLGGMQLALLRRFFDLADYSPDDAIEHIREVYLHGLAAK